MSRCRLYPTPAQEVLLLEQCGHARYVGNLGLEQRLRWRRWQGPTPGLAEQNRELTEARAAEPWLADGSVTVQQQALRDLDQAWRNVFAGTHARPTWRQRGQHEGFRVVGAQALRVRADNRRWSAVWVPKVGWVKVRRSRDLPSWKSYRVTRDRAGRWHLAFAAIPDPIPAPGTGEVVGADLARRFDVTRVEDLNVKGMTRSARGTPDAPGRGVRQKTGLNRGILKAGWSLLVTRLEQKAPGRVEKINPAYTSQTCHACQHVASASREN